MSLEQCVGRQETLEAQNTGESGGTRKPSTFPGS